MYNSMRETMMSMRVKEVVGSQWTKARKEVFENNINKFSLLLVDANMVVRTYVTYRILLLCSSYF
jgi:hypothetical protein